MKIFKLNNYLTPVSHYPAKKNGGVEIKKVKRHEGIFFGEGVRGILYYEYTALTVLTELKIDGRTWMVDEPQFVWSLESFAQRAKGSVLVAGLGLGIVVHQLVKNKEVKTITVVELNKSVINLIRPLLPKDKRIEIIHDDFMNYVDYDHTLNKRNTIIWDLAVRGPNFNVNVDIIPVLRPLLMLKYGEECQVFVHGLDRDPKGERFIRKNRDAFLQAKKGLV